jgi:energy-coupling factor transporter ATP-binding protein EcfA2
MAIERVEIQDFLVFEGEFSAAFCPGVNVLIGGNGTGKTTLMKVMYDKLTDKIIICNGEYTCNGDYTCGGNQNVQISGHIDDSPRSVYIPEKDILEHAKGLLTFIEQKQTGFSKIYRDVLIAAQDVPTQEQSDTQKSIGQKIVNIIGGEVRWDKGDGSFYTLKTDGNRISFANEASGYKKFGVLGLLVSSGQLEPGAVLFWDEPENSLNPELVPVLVDILLELSWNGVQIFIATHDYNLARYFDVRKDKSIPVMFHNLSKTDKGYIVCNSSPEYIKVPDNLLEIASADLFKAVVADALEVQDDV